MLEMVGSVYLHYVVYLNEPAYSPRDPNFYALNFHFMAPLCYY